jgi:hypothetical protein
MTASAYSLVSGYGNVQVLSDGSMKNVSEAQLLGLIYNELRILNELVRIGLNIPDETDSFRGDPGYQASTTLTTPV